MNIELIKEHIDDVIRETNFTNLGKKKVGKVRDIYEKPDTLTLIATDRHSSFDRIIAHIPFKGEVLNQISLFWFDQTKDIVPNHVLSSPDPNVTVGKKCKMVPVEAVVRGYLTGVTDTAIWTRYGKGERSFGGVTLSDGMKKNQKLSQPIFDPTTKEETHDRTLTAEEMVKEGLITPELFDKIRKTAFSLFARGQELALSRGLILVDTKYEFGLDENGVLTLIDEIHTPDSSRYWKAGSYGERFSKGEEPEYFDKEFLRLWFRDNCDPYKDEVLPKAPPELIAELSRRYIEIYETITGQPFNHDFSQPTMERITKNLRK